MSFKNITLLALISASVFIYGTASGAAPAVTAVLSNADAIVGEMVQLQIRINGDRKAEAPEEIAVDGLEIHRTGTEQHFEMNNLSVSSSVTYNYTVLPERAGSFKIPSQSIQVGGSTVKTPELTLRVTDGGGGSAKSARGGQRGTANEETVSTKNAAFLEIVVPKRNGYVGEVLPVEVRVGFNTRVRLQRYEPPEITAQGLTLRKAQQPKESTQTINGITYDVLTWKAAMSATYAGKIEVPPLQTKAVVLMPRRRSSSTSRQRSPFDIFGMNDPFNDPMFSDPFSAMAEPRQITVKSEPVTLDIKSLPPNAPASFTGAVGNFSVTADANPKSVQTGDPITVTATVAGRGNFERVNAPTLEDERGWHKYPPSAKYKQDDDVGISGTKAFEMVLSTTERKPSIPRFLFTYFDPVKEDYVTARSEAISVQIQGGSATASSAPAPSPANNAATATPAAAAAPSASSTDILHQLSERGPIVRTFQPIYSRREFWLAQLLPAAVLAAFIAWAFRRRTQNDRAGREAAALRREMGTVLETLRKGAGVPHEYFAQAARALQLKTALVRRTNPDAVDAAAAADTLRADIGQRESIREIFEKRDEMRYSGRNANGELTPERRREVLELIENLRA